MSKLKTLYNIIPIDDNCSFMCKSSSGEYYSTSKANIGHDIDGKKLIFADKDIAQNYINRYMGKDKYFVQEFGGNEDIYNMVDKDTSVSFVNGHCEV